MREFVETEVEGRFGLLGIFGCGIDGKGSRPRRGF